MSVRLVQRVLIVVMLLAAAALFLANMLGTPADHQPTAAVAQPVTVFPVVEVVQDIKQGQVVRAADIKTASRTVAPPPGSFTRLDEVEGRVAKRAIAAAATISSDDVTVKGGGRLAQLVPPGLRAVALRVTDDSAVANLIQPGDRIDVMSISNAAATQLPGVPPGDRTARTILQNIQVLAVGDAIIGDKPNSEVYRNVTMALTPRQAAVLTVARTVGTQILSLRATDDESLLEEAQVSGSMEDLGGTQRSLPPPPRETTPAAARESVEIIVGNGRGNARNARGGQ